MWGVSPMTHDNPNLKALIVTLAIFFGVAALFIYDSISLGEAYTTTGEIVSFGEITQKDTVINVAFIKLENGRDAMIKNNQYATGIHLNLICYRAPPKKTQSCKVRQ
ncbi:MAG: hypothetical protein ACI9N9_000383 [Enterobacterales bacterium]|jgi:hypothetical protein